ncbi:MAG: PIN domain nuclease [Candidatus Dormibacteria bacterium]
MILPDTSAWIEFLRGTGSPTHLRLRALVSAGAPLATAAPVVMEVLSGARNDVEERRLLRLLLSLEFVAMNDVHDGQDAARLHRRCRVAGDTVKSLIDCLIAVIAMRSDAELLHRDRDFTVIAKHAPLRIAPA